MVLRISLSVFSEKLKNRKCVIKFYKLRIKEFYKINKSLKR